MGLPTTFKWIPKTLAFWAVFMVMYAVFRFFPIFPLSLICGVNETVFQHFKAAFFAYLILTAIEYFLLRLRIQNRERFLYARLQSALFIPWLIFLVWYIVPAVFGQLSIPLEIVWANLSLLVVVVIILIFERIWETSTYTRAQKAVIWALIFLSIALFLRFTFGPLPWADVFVEPNWR